MTLIEKYEAAINAGDIRNDPLQRLMLDSLQRLIDDLGRPKHSWFRRKYKRAVKGIYLYGPVGGGKSFLMNLIYEQVNEPFKVRFHFHHFMQQIDAQLRKLQGQVDPLKKIAALWAKSTRFLCLDEFMVYDIADAMILAELLKAFFEHDIVIMATSNTRPDDLYLNGLQRARFLPAIALLKEHCEVLVLAENRDYRLGRTPLLQAYIHPLNELASRSLEQQFNAIALKSIENIELVVQNRKVPYVKLSEQAVWFEFDVICNLPRSQLDYLELANRFRIIFLSNVPRIGSEETSRAILFIHFIDVMYDNGIQVVISAEAPPEELYTSGAMVKEFKRTVSRLKEMQSADYLRRRG